VGTDEEIQADFIRVRDEIRKAFYELYEKINEDK
jgi:hypothetical protein